MATDYVEGEQSLNEQELRSLPVFHKHSVISVLQRNNVTPHSGTKTLPQSVEENGVPFYHTFCRHLTKAEKDFVAAQGIVLKTGAKNHFTRKENKQLLRNWHKMVVDLQLDSMDPLKYFSKSNNTWQMRKFKESVGFYPNLCSGLNERTAVQISMHLKLLFESEKPGAYSAKEDEELLTGFELFGANFVAIRNSLSDPQRSLKSIRDRITILKPKSFPKTAQVKGKFSYQESRDLVLSVMKSRGVTNVHEIFEIPESSIQWESVKIKDRTARQCQRNWIKLRKRYMEGFNKITMRRTGKFKRLLNHISQQNVATQRKVYRLEIDSERYVR